VAEQVDRIPSNGQPVIALHKGKFLEIGRDNIFPTSLIAAAPAYETIYDRIAAQPQSHQDLLQDVELAIDEAAMEELLSTPSPILMASNGGVVPGHGSFGWVIKLGASIIARGKGQAHGPDPRSFWAEGYSMGSGLLFLRLL
jgi:hypothetical protein